MAGHPAPPNATRRALAPAAKPKPQRQRWGIVASGLLWLCSAGAATTPPAEAAEPQNSNIDAPLFYQLLIGEIELRAGEAGTAYEVLLDAARRTKDELLFRRAMEVALQARAGDQALAATKAWRASRPESTEAMRYQIQLLMVLNRVPDVAEPLRSWLAAIAPAERPGLISSLPRLLARAEDRTQAATLLEGLLAPYRDAAPTRTAARVALGRVWLSASQPAKALELARSAQADEPDAPGPALLALDLMPVAAKDTASGPDGRSDGEGLHRQRQSRQCGAAGLCARAHPGPALPPTRSPSSRAPRARSPRSGPPGCRWPRCGWS